MKTVRVILALGAAIMPSMVMPPAAAEHFTDQKCQCPECTKICCPEKAPKKEKDVTAQ